MGIQRTLFGLDATRRPQGEWSQRRRVPRSAAWWRFNWTAFMGFVEFLDAHPGTFSASVSWHGPTHWTIRRRKGRILVSLYSGEQPSFGWPRRFLDRSILGVVTGRMVRRHGVSEAFMNYLVEIRTSGDGWSYLTPPRYLHRFPLTRCKHGHSLTDPRNVYTLTRKRKGAVHVERRCRSCNRERVRAHRV